MIILLICYGVITKKGTEKVGLIYDTKLNKKYKFEIPGSLYYKEGNRLEIKLYDWDYDDWHSTIRYRNDFNDWDKLYEWLLDRYTVYII